MKKITTKDKPFKTTVFLLVSAFGLAFSVQANELLIERVEAKAASDIPQKAASMNQVRAQYGDPVIEHAAVGEPPITRWEYADFIVYFENQYVITSVLKKSKATDSDTSDG